MVSARAILTGLYAITDASLMPGDQLFSKAEAALRGGARLLQYRNKAASANQRRHEAGKLCALCHRYGALFIVNDDVDVALAVAADGVHVGQGDTALAEVRRNVGSRMIVGVSCHGSLELAQQAQHAGADYVAFGRFFASHTKPQAPACPPDVLSLARQQLAIPRVAIGGITRDNAPRVLAHGADMVAVIHDLFVPDDLAEIEARAHTFSQLFLKTP